MARKRLIRESGAKLVYADGDVSLYQAPANLDPARVSIVVEGDERMFETRAYRIVPPGFAAAEAHSMKILAKTRPDGLIWWVMKLENAEGGMYNRAFGDENGWQSEEAYRAAVARCEEPLRAVGLLKDPVVVTGDEWYAKAREAGRRQQP
jgi:hypothetical protein